MAKLKVTTLHHLPLLLEIAAVAIILICCIHLLSERITTRSFPDGDEGSWMAVSAELSRGNGFTTRWLEHPFLTPWKIPRPDDYRYPLLSSALALFFKIRGISYTSALETVALLFCIYTLLVYFTIRSFFGIRTALSTLLLTTFSLLQLHWNSMVYTEGLFGIGIAILLLAVKKLPASKLTYWLTCGLVTGALYYVRPNAILFFPAFWISWFLNRKNGARWWMPLSGAALFMVTISPWLIRNTIYFGNPFHLAGSAGLLRVTMDEPLTYSVLDFFSVHGMLHPFRATAVGFLRFFTTLNFYEHGLHFIPLALAVVAMVRRRPFYDYFVAGGFFCSFILCCYTSFNSWAGTRYFSPFLPFVYGYGVSELFILLRKIPVSEHKVFRSALTPMVLLLLLVPVINPHRYYERTLAKKARPDQNYGGYIRQLSSFLPANGYYMAASLAQINFMTEYRCIGMQEFFDSTEALRAIRNFNPSIIAMTASESKDSRYSEIFGFLRRNGIDVDKKKEDDFAVYFQIGHSP